MHETVRVKDPVFSVVVFPPLPRKNAASVFMQKFIEKKHKTLLTFFFAVL